MARKTGQILAEALTSVSPFAKTTSQNEPAADPTCATRVPLFRSLIGTRNMEHAGKALDSAQLPADSLGKSDHSRFTNSAARLERTIPRGLPIIMFVKVNDLYHPQIDGQAHIQVSVVTYPRSRSYVPSGLDL